MAFAESDIFEASIEVKKTPIKRIIYIDFCIRFPMIHTTIYTYNSLIVLFPNLIFVRFLMFLVEEALLNTILTIRKRKLPIPAVFPNVTDITYIIILYF